MSLFDVILILVAFGSVALLLHPRLIHNRFWRAVVTPLASIIGSGFLVVAPLLYFSVGSYALIAMAGIVLLAYTIGAAIRFNIQFVEPFLEQPSDPHLRWTRLIRELERFSNLILSFAYIVSVAFYLRLLASFVFEGIGYNNELLENVLTTAILLTIGIVGYLRGLQQLEFLEEYSVATKLGIIATLLLGLFFYDLHHPHFPMHTKAFSWTTLEILGGILLVVQGFETSKYLKGMYSIQERVQSMRAAQIISGIIYIVFVALITPLLYHLHFQSVDETAIIQLSRYASIVLPYLLILGAVMSQFSAAVADTIGSGGLLSVETHGTISFKTGYLMVALIGSALVWSANIFEIITYASRAFALYYLLQVLIAMIFARYQKLSGRAIAFFVLALILLFIVIFGKPAG